MLSHNAINHPLGKQVRLPNGKFENRVGRHLPSIWPVHRKMLGSVQIRELNKATIFRRFVQDGESVVLRNIGGNLYNGTIGKFHRLRYADLSEAASPALRERSQTFEGRLKVAEIDVDVGTDGMENRRTILPIGFTIEWLPGEQRVVDGLSDDKQAEASNLSHGQLTSASRDENPSATTVVSYHLRVDTLPLLDATAMTTHKAQGLTVPRFIISLEQTNRSPEIFYVAYSY